jgi:hypothetical protein
MVNDWQFVDGARLSPSPGIYARAAENSDARNPRKARANPTFVVRRKTQGSSSPCFVPARETSSSVPVQRVPPLEFYRIAHRLSGGGVPDRYNRADRIDLARRPFDQGDLKSTVSMLGGPILGIRNWHEITSTNCLPSPYPLPEGEGLMEEVISCQFLRPQASPEALPASAQVPSQSNLACCGSRPFFD